MQLKDGKRFVALNTDDHPSILGEGEITDALNVRLASSDQQHGAGIAETLQGEIEILINPEGITVYYGDAIGGDFIYDGFSEILIGNQVWMKRNYDVDYPGSKIYNDDEANLSIYGRLYTHNQAMSSDFCPEGWHVPTEADIDELLAFLGGEMVGGGILKEVDTDRWAPPNIGATDAYGFRALPGGKFDDVFTLLGYTGLFWIASNATAPLLDKDGNEYTSLIIGTQEWILENLRVQTYADGTAIPNITDADIWANGNDETKDTYGALYNWYAVTNIHNIAPTGWHVPTENDFFELLLTLNGAGYPDYSGGGKLKEIGTTHWDSPNTGATDIYGFRGLPSGMRSDLGSFAMGQQQLFMYSSSLFGPQCFVLTYNNDFLSDAYYGNNFGLSIRCILDGVDPANPGTVTDIDGNVYTTVKIGTQVWMAENLKVEHYNDGTDIPIITDDALWAADIAGAMCYYSGAIYVLSDGYCYYDNDEATYKNPYGALYNRLAVDSAHGIVYFERGGVQEAGWRIPSIADLEALALFLGDEATAGAFLKEIGLAHWYDPNTGATNLAGFTALPAGTRDNLGSFVELGIKNYLWNTDALKASYLNYDDIIFNIGVAFASTYGFSIRCVRDIIP